MQAVIVAANPEDRDFYSYVLRYSGLAVARTAESQHIESALVAYPVDLILLVPDARATPVPEVENVRRITQAPLLLLVERLSEAEHSALLDAGADIVLERPVEPGILSRYVRMLLRRAGTVPAAVLAVVESRELRLEPETRRVSRRGGEAIQLTPLEFRLLYLLMTNQGHVIPIETIVERVWGYSGEGNRELVRGLVRRLRLKIEPDPADRHLIENIPGAGYRFMAD